MGKEKDLEKIHEFIDKFGRTLVGVLLKRLEVLDKEETLSPEQVKSLYKSLTKENVYEQIRNLKALLEVYFNIGTIKFNRRDK